MYTLSDWIGTTTTFKIENVVHLASSGLHGSEVLTIVSRPVPPMVGTMRKIDGDVITTSLSREGTTAFGVANYANFQMMKESSVVAAQNASVQAHTWCCLIYTGADGSVIPQDWINNRNEQCNLPAEYMARRFETISQNQANLRCQVLM